MKFDFSIIIPTKNEEKNIEKCLKSILCQTQRRIEILIVDSLSSDKTILLIKNLIKKKRNDVHIRIIKKNCPAEKAMAYGIHKSKGEIISFLGADDRLYNQNTLRYVNKKLDSKKFEILYGSYQIIDEEDNPIKIIKSVKFDRDFILNKENYICATSLFFKKTIFNKVKKSLDDGYDFAFILKYSKHIKFLKTGKILSMFKIHEMSNSTNFYKNLINIKKDYFISKKYGGKFLNNYHRRYLIIKILSNLNLLWIAELKRKFSLKKLLNRNINFKKNSKDVKDRILQKV